MKVSTRQWFPNRNLDDLALVLVAVWAVAELAVHPVKTWRLVRHGKGWYE